MIVDIKSIGSKGLQVTDTIDASDINVEGSESLFMENLEYSVFFTRDGDRIKAKGRVTTLVVLKCVRCIEEFEFKVNSDFDVILFPADMVDVSVNALGADEMEYIFYDGKKIDVIKILLEQVGLYIPLNPICQKKCNGLCPNCGTNLNYDKCKCDVSDGNFNFFNIIKR